MAFTQLPNKNPGDLIKSVDWNEAIQELIDLRVQKLSHTNGTGTNLTINGPLAIGGSVSFGSQTRQMLNLFGTSYGIGVQSATLYSRSDNDFAWYRDGVHDNARGNPGAGGARLMALNESGDLTVTGIIKGQSYQVLDTTGVPFPDAWIGMANNIDAATKWLHIGGITDGGTRRIALFANRTLVSGNLDVSGDLKLASASGNEMMMERGLLNRGGFVVFNPGGAGPDPNNLIVSCARVNSGGNPTYKFVVGHWVHTPGSSGGGGLGGAFIINSSDDFEARFRVNSDGRAFADNGFQGNNADYAEFFESENGKEIAAGTSVLLGKDGKIRAAKKGEVPLSIISVNPIVLANDPIEWPAKYLRDDWGRYVLNEQGGRTLNPDFDPKKTYTPREERAEWNKVGLLGQLRLKKGQPVAPAWVKIKDLTDQIELWLVK